MEDQARGGSHEYSLASRKAEEADLRRYQASHWLECLVGPLGISSQPSEREFISCLRNGLVLCKLMNIIQPGSVPKVVVSQPSSKSQTWDSQHLPAAYQYFENVRNFLAAIEALKIPAFEASIFERDSIQEGSSSKVVDCILALKAYHEWQQMTGDENGIHKPLRSPYVVHLSGRINTQSSAIKPSDNCQHLDMSASCNKQLQTACDNQKLQGLIVKALTELMLDTKENIDTDMIGSFQDGEMDAIEVFGRILSTCLEQGIQKYPEWKSGNNQSYMDKDSCTGHTASCPPPNILNPVNKKSCRACLRNDDHCKCKHKNLVDLQEKELLSLKALLSSAKKDFEDLQTQLENDLKQIGIQVQEMSFAANKYHTAVEENRSLYNMVQDLKGNIRVYCRIRPVFNGAQTVIDFIGQDGSLVLIDPLKSRNEGRKSFRFNHVFGPTASQEEVFKETQPLIRSVMDGYNVCIFAYGQTGSGKTYTMCGPNGGSTTELGINYLALNDLFQLSYERENIIKYKMYVQMVEIYNEQVRDLLTEDSSVSKLEILSCSGDNNFALPDVSIHRVTSTTDVIRLMKFGEINRAVSSTTINECSSRSHSVLTIHVHVEDVSRCNSSKLHSCLHLVDLAGSERVDKSGVTGEGLIEAQHINKSLSCLGDVIMALAQKNPHIPYRNSKLTLLLQNALGGHAKTLMLAHVSPEEESFGETMSTLKFAQRVSTVELGASGVVYKESNEVLELKLQIESLKAALGSKESTSSATQRNKTPIRKAKTFMEKTPPRTRRLSIENCSNRKEERMNFESRKGSKTPPIPPRPRRLSMEGGGDGGGRFSNKDSEQIKLLDSINKKKHVKMEATFLQTPPRQLQDVGSMEKLKSTLPKLPPSPTNSPFHDFVIEKPDVKPKMLQLHQNKTPEPTLKTYKKERTTKSEYDPPLKAASNTTTGLSNNGAPHGKGSSSQIKKSLRSIGKFINSSDKRNQQKLAETTTPVSRIPQEPKSPISSARTLRRQSLTGGVSASSRRSSLGGVVDPKRNSKTPPPAMRASINQSDKRWL